MAKKPKGVDVGWRETPRVWGETNAEIQSVIDMLQSALGKGYRRSILCAASSELAEISKREDAKERLGRAQETVKDTPPPTPQKFDCECVIAVAPGSYHARGYPYNTGGLDAGDGPIKILSEQRIAWANCPRCHGTGRKADLPMSEAALWEASKPAGFASEEEAREWYLSVGGTTDTMPLGEDMRFSHVLSAQSKEAEGDSFLEAATNLRDQLEPGWRKTESEKSAPCADIEESFEGAAMVHSVRSAMSQLRALEKDHPTARYLESALRGCQKKGILPTLGWSIGEVDR